MTSESSSDFLQYGSLDDFEKHALSILPKCVKDYYNSGEGEEFTIRWNKKAFNKYRIIPRMLRDVSQRHLNTTVLGEWVSMPVGISPTAFHKLAHPRGECASARAAEAAKTIYVLSLYATSSIQEVAKASPNCIKWLQTIIFKDRDLTLHQIRRAEEHGFKALVVIIDNPTYGTAKMISMKECYERYIKSMPILEEYVASKSDLAVKHLNNMPAYLNTILDDSLTWDDVAWLKSVTKLPIILKGILSPEDALLGVKHGASAIFVSNHGGRQLDGEPATIEVLSDIVQAVGDKVEVYLDGGITKGTDVFKALALGARMVFLGKSMLWSLACGGEEGSRAALEILRQELDSALALTGCSDIKKITSDMIKHESYYNR